jgi:hypothetical protein
MQTFSARKETICTPVGQAEREIFSRGSHYDYEAQKWINGHDHGHLTDGRVLFSCIGIA